MAPFSGHEVVVVLVVVAVAAAAAVAVVVVALKFALKHKFDIRFNIT